MSVNKFDLSRRDLIKMALMAGAAGIVAGFSGSLSPIMAAGSQFIYGEEGKFPSDSNAVILYTGADKTEVTRAEIIFPKGDTGYMTHDRFEFRDYDDLMNYLSQLFPAVKNGSGIQGFMKRTGMYRRIDVKGNPIFTFGDPILDLITNEDGILVIGSKKYNIRDMELADADQRGGGIIEDELRAENRSMPQILKASYVQQAAPPSELYFPSSTAYKRMRFRAFRRNRLAYWRVGGDIQTKHQDFTFGAVSNEYGGPSNTQDECLFIGTSSDSDSTDNYVESSFWGTGNTPIPGGVSTICTADWQGVRYSDRVQKGCTGGIF